MKAIKMLGLAALAALTAMALVGVSSAMATESTSLCKVDEEPCKEANQIKHVHEETAAVAPALLLNDLGADVKCDVLFLGDITVTLAKPLTPLLVKGKFTYSNCKRGEGNCTVEETVAGTSVLKALRTADELAEVTGEGTVKVVCGNFINCVYKGAGLKGHGFGALKKGPNGETTLEEKEVEKVEGFLCPKTAKLDILTTPLEATYIKS